MPSANSGNAVTAIRYLKKSIRVTIGEKDYNLTPEAFTDHYLYVGKVLTPTELGEIGEAAELYKHECYVMRLVAKGLYTKKQIINKLYARQAKGWMVHVLIDKLGKYALLDDEAFLKERLEYGHARLEGFYHIIEDLRVKGITEEKLREIHYDHDQEMAKAAELYPRVQRAQINKARLAAREAVYEWYSRHGFPEEIVQAMAERMASESGDERLKLRQELAIAHRKYDRKYKGRERQDRIVKYLLQKGYNYGDISAVLGEGNNDDIG